MGRRGRPRYFSTVDFSTGIPSFRKSPMIRGDPHRGFVAEISRISSRTSLLTAGRPGFFRLIRAQCSRNLLRCQQSTVAGYAKTKPSRHRAQCLANHAQGVRSLGLMFSRRIDRRYTPNRRRSTAISSWRTSRDRNTPITKSTRAWSVGTIRWGPLVERELFEAGRLLQILGEFNREDDYRYSGSTAKAGCFRSPERTDVLLTVLEGNQGQHRFAEGMGHFANRLIRQAGDESGYLATPIVRRVRSP